MKSFTHPLAAPLRLALGVLLVCAAPAAGSDPMGFVAALEGEVAIRSPGGRWRPAAVDSPVGAGDALRTGVGAAVKLLFADDTLLVLDESSALGVAAKESPGPGAGAAVLRLAAGRARVTLGGAPDAAGAAELRTATAVVSGTASSCDVLFEAAPELWTYVCSVAGAVRVRNLDPGVPGLALPEPGGCVRVGQPRSPERIGWRPGRLAVPAPRIASRPPGSDASVPVGLGAAEAVGAGADASRGAGRTGEVRGPAAGGDPASPDLDPHAEPPRGSRSGDVVAEPPRTR